MIYVEAVNLNRKENIIEAYGIRPTLPYDIEGVLVEAKGKDIKVEKTIEDRKVSYSIRLKEEVDAKVGKNIKVDRENILSIKIEEKTETIEEVSLSYSSEEVIKRLGLEYTEETKKAVEYLVDNQIPITKEDIESFLISKKYLKEIVENIDFDSCIKLLDRDIDFKKDSLQKVAKALQEINEQTQKLSFKELLNLNRKLSYKEAETIGKQIYGRKMGKDIYDSIIALHKEKIPINKQNIERVVEVIHKLHALKDYKDENFVKVLKDDLPLNIETLYKLKHSYNNKKLNKNITSSLYEQFTIEREISLEDILILLKELDIEENEENIKLLREFFINEVEITKENYEKVIYMKANLKELINILDEENVAKLIETGKDPLKEEIPSLIEKIKTEPDTKKNVNLDETLDILKEMEGLKTITDKELLQLIKNGKDFKIENLKNIVDTNTTLSERIEGKTVEKAITISNIFNTLGDLNSETISLAVKKYNTITLNNLYDSHIELTKVKEMIVEPINKTEESFIREEYLNARDNTTLNLIKMSIKDGIELEHVALDELNQYIDKRVNKYRETQRLVNEIKHIKGKEETLIPMVMKNGLNMSVDQINNINSILNNGKGIGNIFNSFLKGQDYTQDKEIIEGIGILEKRIKEFSSSLKEGKSKVKEDYKDILDSFKELNNSFNSTGRNKDGNLQQMEEYLNLQNKLSKDDLILQLPIKAEEGYNNVNLIIPNIKKGIDKNSMVFYLNMDTENLGQVIFNLEVKGNEVSIDFQTEKEERILKNDHILKDGLSKIGYLLEKIQPSNMI